MTGSPAYPTGLFPLVTYGSGNIRFEFMPSTYSLRLSALDANRIFERYGAYNDQARYPGRVIQPVLYSCLSEGRRGHNGVLVPTYLREPVWIVVLTDIPFAGTRGHTPVPENAITIISDRQGTGIGLMIDVPDPNPLSRR